MIPLYDVRLGKRKVILDRESNYVTHTNFCSHKRHFFQRIKSSSRLKHITNSSRVLRKVKKVIEKQPPVIRSRRIRNTPRNRVMQPLYELYKGLPVMRSEEGTMSESNTKLSYIPIKDKLHHFFRNKGIADLAKSYLGKVSEKQNQIQKLHNGAVRRFLINYNVSVLKI